MSVFRVGSNEFLIIAEENRKEILLSFARLIQNTILEQKKDKASISVIEAEKENLSKQIEDNITKIYNLQF